MYISILTGCLFSAVLLACARAIYNLYFHPLAKFPGPRLWIAFPILRRLVAIRGTFDRQLRRYHGRYGEVVRFSNDELSFITAEAWKDIYGYGQGHKQLPKPNTQEDGAPPNIVFSNDTDHARYRKSISHGFSEKGLRVQEPLIKTYVDDLNGKLKEEAAAGNAVDLTMWFNLTTFDIISDLAFGKSFGLLKSRGYNEYIRAMFNFLKATDMVLFVKNYPLLWNFTLGLFYSRYLKKSRSDARTLSAETAMERIHDTESMGRGDLMDSMLRHRGQKDGLEDWEIGANANVLFVAGSETTSTLLTGLAYHLLKNPDVLRKVVDEVRATFEREEDIDFNSATAKLPYMLAVLSEGFRTYPPVPGILERITERPVQISGYEVPPNTKLGVHQSAAYSSRLNFYNPDEFVPERWLSSASTDPSSPYYNDNRDVVQPFSVGPRNCIGRNLAYNEMRLILARMLWNFDMSFANGGPADNVGWLDQKSFIVWEKKPLMVNLVERQKA